MADEDDDSLAITVGADILGAMDEEFHDAPDRVLAIVGAAYMDALLEQLLRTIFVDDRKVVNELVGMRGPLGSNGSRYRLAYCLGLISAEERDDLSVIASIRNAFAHRYDVRTFDHEKATELLSTLHVGKQLDAIIADLLARTSDPLEQQTLRDLGKSGRKKFRDTVFNLFAVLVRKLDSVAKPTHDTWYPPPKSAV